MSKKPSKGSRPPKSFPPPAEPEPNDHAGEQNESAEPPASTNESVAQLWRLVRRWFPVAGVIVAIVLAFTHGVALSVLVLAGTAMLLAIAAIWASLQTLAGDRPESLDGAVQLTVSGGESEQKAFLLRALKDLEFERSLGKISDQDYEDLKRSYRARAKEVLQELDKRNESARAEAEKTAREWLASRGLAQLDDQPKVLTPHASDAETQHADLPAQQREEIADAPDDTAEAKPPVSSQPAASEGRRMCAACGTDNEGDARFCKKCGASMAIDADGEAQARSAES